MAVFKRDNSPMLYFKFVFNGKQYLRSAKTTITKVAEKREREFRVQLENEAFAPPKEKPQAALPRFKDFVRLPDEDEEDLGGQWWVDYANAQYATKPKTRDFYRERIAALLKFDPLGDAKLNEIDEVLIDRFVSDQKTKGRKPGTINRNIAALRLTLGKARRWKMIRHLPELPHLKEKKIGRVVTPEQEKVYLAAVEKDQQDFFIMLVDTAIEPGPASELAWGDVHFDQVGKFKFGFIHDRCTKTDARERDLPMSKRLHTRMKERWMAQGRPRKGYVFPADRLGSEHPTPLTTFRSVHKRLWERTEEREPIALPKFRLYDLRHTALTRLRDSGADAFDLMQYAGWASIRMADNYIHTNDASKAKAADRFNAHIEEQEAKVSGD